MEGLIVSTPEFIEFPKMARLSRECVITEKIDGTNAQIFIEEYPEGAELQPGTQRTQQNKEGKHHEPATVTQTLVNAAS